jgi:hypothetical protein
LTAHRQFPKMNRLPLSRAYLQFDISGADMRQTALFALLLLAGCVSRYAVPAASPKATVIFSSDMDGVMVQTFADTSCRKSPSGTRVAYFYKDHFDQRSGTAKDVPAGREFVFTFRSRADTGTVATFCSTTRSFIPEQSQTYRAHFIYAPEGCGVRITKAVSPESGSKADGDVDAAVVEPACLDDFNG